MEGGDFHDILSSIFGLQYKIGFADLAILNTFFPAGALPRVLELVNCVTDEGNQADSLAKKLIVKHRSVLNNAHKMGSQSWNLRNHNSSEGVGQTHIAASHSQLYPFLADL